MELMRDFLDEEMAALGHQDREWSSGAGTKYYSSSLISFGPSLPSSSSLGSYGQSLESLSLDPQCRLFS
jgi:hypothetical protein